jgi:hypothetical protein
MRRPAAIVVLVAVAAWLGAATTAQAGSTLCVGDGTGCYRTIQAALDASHNGDVIAIGGGTFHGGLHVTTDVRIVGAGASRTIIRGGASVITIGTFGATQEPTVSIAGVTITGGVAHSSPESIPFVGESNVLARGGGVEIPPNADFSGGATVTISRSVISRNRVAPTHALALGPPCPGGVKCPFAAAVGAGIDSWGTLTLVHSAVRDNLAAGLASDADGAGIASELAPLTLRDTVVAGNRAVATIPNGRFAEGGGVFVEGGRLRIVASVVTANHVSLRTNLPAFAGGELIDMNANSGGIHVGDGIPTFADHIAVTANSVLADGPQAEPCAFDSAMLVGDSPLVIHHALFAGNRVTGIVKTSADIGPCGSVLDSDGGGATISDVRIVGNVSTSISRSGSAAENGGLSILGSGNHPFRFVNVSEGLIRGNVAIARSATGSATVEGAGVFNNALLRLTDVTVTRNRGRAVGPTGVAEGGGIWSGVLLTGPPVRLVLRGDTISHNQLLQRPGITRRGGGLFSSSPLAIAKTAIFANSPDNCVGC